MKVSVVIPVYNHSKYLRQRFDSILNQTFNNYELIVLDDGSTDNSREIIEEYVKKNPEIITCFNENNHGSPFMQWHKGICLSKGEFIWIAESDDFCYENFLEKAISVLMKSTDVGLVFCDSMIVDQEHGIEYLASERKSAVKKEVWDSFHKYSLCKKLKLFLENPVVNASSVVFRKSLYFEIGGVEQSMKFCGDWMFYTQLATSTEFKYISESLNVFRLHEESSYHEYYRSNIFLKEKIKVYSFILKKSGLPISIIVMALWGICKSIIIRLIYILKMERLIIPYFSRLSKTRI